MQLFWSSRWMLTAGIFLIASLCHMKAGFLVATYMDVRWKIEEMDRKKELLFFCLCHNNVAHGHKHMLCL